MGCLFWSALPQLFAFDARPENILEIEENFLLNDVKNGSGLLAPLSAR